MFAGSLLKDVLEEEGSDSESTPLQPQAVDEHHSDSEDSKPRAPPPLVRAQTQNVVYGVGGGVPGVMGKAGYTLPPHLQRRGSAVGAHIRELGEPNMIEKLHALTDDALEDDDELADMYSVVKRKMSAPAGLTKTLYNLYVNNTETHGPCEERLPVLMLQTPPEWKKTS